MTQNKNKSKKRSGTNGIARLMLLNGKDVVQEDNIVDFCAFYKCFDSNRGDWEGRALVFIGCVSSFLFWERMLGCRLMLDEGKSCGFLDGHGELVAEHTADQCLARCQLYLMKAVRYGCALNSEIRNHCGVSFILRRLKRSDELAPYNYCPADALKLVYDFEDAFQDEWVESDALYTTRWDILIRRHRKSEQMINAA